MGPSIQIPKLIRMIFGALNSGPNIKRCLIVACMQRESIVIHMFIHVF